MNNKAEVQATLDDPVERALFEAYAREHKFPLRTLTIGDLTAYEWEAVEKFWQGWKARAALQTTLAAQNAAPTEKWTCFHCGESFTDRAAAALHFGSTERQAPICGVSQQHYREMEARMEAYNAEDADIHRQMHAMESKHQQALRRAEEEGYAKGLRDAIRFPADAAVLAAASHLPSAASTPSVKLVNGMKCDGTGLLCGASNCCPRAVTPSEPAEQSLSPCRACELSVGGMCEHHEAEAEHKARALQKGTVTNYGTPVDNHTLQAEQAVIEAAARIFDFKAHKQTEEAKAKYLAFAAAVRSIPGILGSDYQQGVAK